MQLPPTLSFLEPLLVPPEEEFRTAEWLLSQFDASKWLYSFEYKNSSRELNWNIALHDRSSLTDAKNATLLNGLKYYLTSSTRGKTDNSSTNCIVVQAKQFSIACRIVDYILINGERFQIGKYGLEGITAGDLKKMLDDVSSSPSSSESVYQWSKKLKEYCLKLVELTDFSEIQHTLQKHPLLNIITDEQTENDKLGICHELIPAVRASLFINKLYGTPQSTYGIQPNTVLLSQQIYSESLWGKHQTKPTHEILGYNEDVCLYRREYAGVPTNTGIFDRAPAQTYLIYRNMLYRLGILHEIGVPAPTLDALLEADSYLPNLCGKGRFRTVPSDIVFTSIRNAVEFHINHGEELIRGFCRVALECKKKRISPASLHQSEILKLVGPKLRALGVRRLSLSARMPDKQMCKSSVKGKRSQHFENLRNNRGLYDLLAVYVGGIQLTVGVLMGRRVSELCKLRADSCLDETEKWLLFCNAKSTRGLFGLRRKEARPIDPIAIDMIKSLIKMQKLLKKVGYIKKFQSLFALPNMLGAADLVDSSSHSYPRNLDIFCDYFETPLNSDNRRWYLRQHQLRRFFAMLFFYCGSFSSIDTLRWMLGQTSLRHVWNYITESTDGAVLAGAAAQYVAEHIHQGDTENFMELAELVKYHYGTDNFRTIDSSDLQDYIESLVKEGMVEIEPEFFSDHHGNQMKLVARLVTTREYV